MKSNKSLILILIVILVLIACIACDSGNNIVLGYGSLTVCTDSDQSSRSILPQSSDIAIHHYNISGYLTTDESNTFSEDFTGNSFTKDKLIAGTWSFIVKGYNSSGQMISKSSTTTVTIQQNRNASKTVTVSYLTTGQGTFSITMRIPSIQNVANVHVVLSPVSSHLDQIEVVYNIPRDTGKIDGTKYVYEDSRLICSGIYDATITMLDNDGNRLGLPIIESLHIHKDITSSFVWAWDESYFDSVPNPVFATEPGTYGEGQSVSIITSDADSIIYYTLDNSDPRNSQTRVEYTGAISLNKNTTIKACCVKGSLTSEVVSGVFNIRVATPVLSVVPGTYTDSQRITISCDTVNASIYYTTDGSTPSSYKTLYEEDAEILVTANTTIKVIAKKTNLTDSEIVTANYVIDSQSLGITLSVPTTIYGYELVVPEGWATGTAVINGVAATLYPNITIRGIYYWYVDGEEIRYKNGKKPNYDLLLGTGDGNYELTPGAHIITLKVRINENSYSCSYPLVVSGNGIGVSGNNTTHGVADYKVGDLGPSGGYIYAVNTDYSSGYKYLELYGTSKIGSVLMKSSSSKSFTYDEGLAYCNSINKNGYTDWCVPTSNLIKMFLENDRSSFYVETSYYSNDTTSSRTAWYCQKATSSTVYYYKYTSGVDMFGEPYSRSGIESSSAQTSSGVLIPVRYF